MSTARRVLPWCQEPRFRIVRIWRVGEKNQAEIIGSADTPSEAMRAVFAEKAGRVLAVDRRGFTYAESGRPIEVKP